MISKKMAFLGEGSAIATRAEGRGIVKINLALDRLPVFPASTPSRRHEADLDAHADRVIARMETVAPGFTGSILHRQPPRCPEVVSGKASDGPGHGGDEVLAPHRGRAGPVRRVPAGVPLAGGAAGFLLRADASGRCDRPDDVRALQRLLRGPDREEAPQPFPARVASAVVWHGGVQSWLPVLPELGHLQVAGDRHAGRRGVAGGDCPGRRGARLPQRGRSPTTTRSSFWN